MSKKLGSNDRTVESAVAFIDGQTQVEVQTEVAPPKIVEQNGKSSVQKVKHRKSNRIKYPVREKIGLEVTDTLAEAGRKVVGFYFARMLQNEPGTRRGKAVKAVHQMRVAIRRMQTALRLFGAGLSKKTIKPLAKGLKATARVLGQVRDLDVSIKELKEYQRSLPKSEQAILQPLLDTWLAERKQARQQMLAYLDSKRYLKFKQDLLEFVQTEGLGAKSIPRGEDIPYQLRHLAPALIYERYQAARAYEGVGDPAALDRLHQLRLRLKQLRYTLECFQDILGDESKMVIEEITILQDHLGHLNDADMANRLLREWNRVDLPTAEPQSPTPVAAYHSSKLDEQQRLMATFPEAWERFNQPELRRNLALAVSTL